MEGEEFVSQPGLLCMWTKLVVRIICACRHHAEPCCMHRICTSVLPSGRDSKRGEILRHLTAVKQGRDETSIVKGEDGLN